MQPYRLLLMICWIKINLNSANKISAHFVVIFLLSKVILSEKLYCLTFHKNTIFVIDRNELCGLYASLCADWQSYHLGRVCSVC
jgi:hypothetical protein